MLFKLNPALGAELRRQPAFQGEVRRVAELAVREVARAAPGKRGSDYQVEQDGEDVIITTHFRAGHIIEWGSVNNPPYSPLRRGVRAAGLTFKEAHQG